MAWPTKWLDVTDIDPAPGSKMVIVWGNGGQRFAQRDKLGQWRNAMGHPFDHTPKYYVPMLPKPEE